MKNQIKRPQPFLRIQRLQNSLLLVAIALGISHVMYAQSGSTQTIRGYVIDDVSKIKLPGVNVRVELPDKVLGSATDTNGEYKIEGIPLGRQTIRVSFIGYEDQVIPNVIVTAGKEVILNFSLTESVSKLDEVIITANSKDDKTATVNDLALVSARSFAVDDTKRYAGALGDPSRMASNFAGVIGGNDSRNDIVVRGNSPLGVLWQIEGLNVPNPNHFGSNTSTGGPVSMLNNNNLDKSDFITSAFPAQYGNANASVFDIRLREGNNEKREYLAQVGFNGFEFGAEGPFKKGSQSSFIVNYRYSTLGLFKTLGIDFGTGSATPLYQDLNFKLAFPMAGNAKLTVFGLLGKSSIDLLGSEADLEAESGDLYGDENTDTYPRYQNYTTGISFEKSLGEKTFVKLSGGFSFNQNDYYIDSLERASPTSSDIVGRFRKAQGDFATTIASVTFLTRTKFNSKNSLTSGFYIDRNSIDFINRDFYPNVNRDTIRVNVNESNVLYQGYSTWKHRFTKNWTLNAGVHAQYYSLNQQAAVEPRLGIRYQINPTNALSLGYGIHNQTPNFYTSYSQQKTSNGYIFTNKDLEFITSQHYVLTYDWNISEFLRLKVETYLQNLTNISVESIPSSFSAINTGASFNPTDKNELESTGTGRNYGLELTLERFFNKGYYFLITSSLFNSTYKGSDGIERNTAYNTQYVFNALTGKEWRVGKGKNYLSLNLKITSIGGKFLTPIDFTASALQGRTIYVESKAFSERQDAYFRTDLRISYRKEYSKSTLEVSLDLQNLTFNQNIFQQSYNPRTNTIATQYQQGFFPVPYIRYTF